MKGKVIPVLWWCVHVCSVVSDSLQPHELQPTRLPCPWDFPGEPVHGISQARILEWVAISSFRGSSQPRDGTHFTCISCFGRQILDHCATWKAYFGGPVLNLESSPKLCISIAFYPTEIHICIFVWLHIMPQNSKNEDDSIALWFARGDRNNVNKMKWS